MIFEIRTPDGIKKLHYNKKTSNKKLIQQVQKYVLDKYDNFLSEYRYTKEAKIMLNDCATYLMRGSNNGKTLTKDKIKTINENEIPLSKVKNKFIEDYLYGNVDVKDGQFYDSNIESVDQYYIDYCDVRVNELNKEKYKNDKEIVKWKNSKTYKINQLYSSNDKYEEVTDDRVSIYYISKDKLDEYINDESFKFKGNIKTKKVLVHKGRKGIIDKTKPYIAEWKQVNINNEFEFNKNKYKISNKLKQYQLDLDSDKYIMDSVLCYYIPHEDKYYFFDENIDEITKYVKQV